MALKTTLAGLVLVAAVSGGAIVAGTGADGDCGPAAEAPSVPGAPGADAAKMTLDRLHVLIGRVGESVERDAGGQAWQFTVAGAQVIVVADPQHDRMRIMVPVAEAGMVSADDMKRLLQANFDSALDARYAIARGVLWGVFLHPLSPLGDEEFLSGLGQTVNVARTYGSTFSSGAMVYGGGDSQDLLGRELIDELLKKGTPI